MKKTNFFTMIIAMLVCMGLASSTFAYGPNLITNGDFSMGNTGFTTDYTYVAPGGSLYPEGTYAVGSEPHLYHSHFSGSPAVGANFLMVNGATTGDKIVWQQVVPVQAGVDYEFSFMLSSLVTTAPADLEITIKIDDVVMQEVFIAPGEVNKWVKHSWKPMDKSETATITIYETSQIKTGNDFGIDDIQLVALCPDFEDIATINVTDIRCSGDENGKIELILNGAKPFNACIMSGCEMIATDADLTPLKTSTYTFDGLIAGWYTISVKDGNGCMYSVCVEVGDPGPIVADVDYEDILCNGDLTDITVTGTGGTAPYTLYDEQGESVVTFMESYTLIDYPAAVYNWTLGDYNECTPAVIEFEIEQPPVLDVKFEFAPIACFGGSTTVTVEAKGGSGTYELFDGETSKGTFASEIDVVVTKGTYDWTVVDENGCEFDIQVVVVEPTQLTASYKASEILCNGGTSDVVVTVDGGTAPYELITSEVTPTMLKSEFTRTVLAGTYNWAVKDANGCTFDLEFTITEPSALSARYSFDQSSIACFGDEIEITIVAAGATAPYQLFDGEDFVADFTGNEISRMVGDGNYNWTVKDAKGCEIDVNFELTEPDPLSYTEILTDASCFGSEDGMAEITVLGGTAPFSADMGTFDGNVLTITDLEMGIYDVVITDANGCILDVNFAIGQPAELTVTVDEIEVPLCAPENFPGCDEPFAVSVVEYNEGYAQYDGGQIAANRQVLDNVLGTPDESNSDANGITFVTLGFGGSIILEAGCEIVNGDGDDFKIVETSYGQTDCSKYPEKSDVYVAQSLDGPWSFLGNVCLSGYLDLSNGTVSNESTEALVFEWVKYVKVIDATNPDDFGNGDGYDINGISILGGGPATASASVSFSGVEEGVTPSFTVMQGDTEISTSDIAQLNGLMPGTYSVVLTVGECSSQPVEFIVPVFPKPIVATAEVSDVSCFDGNDGSALITILGGTAPYSLAWEGVESFEIAGDTYTIDNLAAGSYTITIIDANGCLEEIVVVVEEPAILAATFEVGEILCNGGQTTIELNITGGTLPYLLTDGAEVNIVIDAEGDYLVGDIFTADTYNWSVVDAKNCSVDLVIEVKEPELLTAAESFEPISCYGGTTSVTVTAEGGTGEYKLYNLAVADENLVATFTTDVTISERSEGTYNWIVVDENDCQVLVNFTITQPLAPLTAEVAPGTIACTDGETTALVTAAGGTAPYYLYNGATLVAEFNDSFLVEELTAGTYNWTVTDANACEPVALSFTLINPEPIVVEVVSTIDILCYNSNTGVIEVSATGGTGDLAYAIEGMPAQDNGLFTELYAGKYTIVVTDENGCTESVNVELLQPEELKVVLTVENASCDGINDGQITGMISGGVGPYNVCLFTECLFDETDQGVPTKSQGMMYWGLEPGTYMVVVRDQNGCMWIECVEVGVNQVELAYDVVEACEVDETLVSFIYPGLENVDDAASLASENNLEHNTALNSISILGGMGTVTAYSDFALNTLGTIVHRGTRGIGIASSPDNDEISQAEGMTVEFTAPVALSAFEVRSLFIEGAAEVPEQGKAVLYLGGIEVANITLIADQLEGGVGQFITTMGAPVMVDKIDFYIDNGSQSFSEFALAKLLLVDVKQLVNIALTPSYPGASSFTYLWSNYETTASLTGVEAGDYSVVVTALDEFGAALCFEEFMISATATCGDLSMPTLPIVNNLGIDVMLTDDMHKTTENSLRAYPNPFTTEATIEFMVNESSEVSVEVFNLIGERVAMVFQGHVNAFDTQKVSFTAESLPNGIYIYKLTAGDKVYNDRIILTR